MRRNFFILISFFFYSLALHSQPVLDIRYNSRNYDERCGPIIYTEENEVFWIVWKAMVPDIYGNRGISYLYKLADSYDTVCWNYQKEDTILNFLSICYDSENHIILGGDAWRIDTAGNYTDKFQWFCKLTTDLEIIWEKTFKIQVTETFVRYQSILLELPGNNYLYANSLMPDTTGRNYSYLFKLSSCGDSIRFFHDDPELKFSVIHSASLSPDMQFYNIHLFGGSGNPPPGYNAFRFSRYDTSFNMVHDQWYSNPDYVSSFNTINYPNDKYISSFAYWPLGIQWIEARYIRVVRFDENLQEEAHIDLTIPDSLKPTYSAWYQGIDYIDPSRVFVAGMEDKHSTSWSPDPSWIYLACVDENLNLIHEEYYGGDALYEVFFVKALPDGGVIVTGTTYNDSIQDHERDGFVMKFDSSLFVGTSDSRSNRMNPTVEIYPNPGHDFLQITCNQMITDFKLFDITGKAVIDQTPESRTITKKVAILNCGMYFWKIVTAHHEIITGKWIKK